MAKKVKTRSFAEGKGSRYRVGEISCCGHRLVVWVDPKLKIEGWCDFETGEIVLRPQAPDRMQETLFHEILHAVIDASGLGWLLRRRVKMTAAQFEEFEEDVIRVLSPAMFGSLRGAGWLHLPKLPGKPRHRKAPT